MLKEIQPVMELDSLNASHPLSLKDSEVETTSDILGLFDSITYSKAGLMSSLPINLRACVYINEKLFMYDLVSKILCPLNRVQLC